MCVCVCVCVYVRTRDDVSGKKNNNSTLLKNRNVIY